jgi:hypothetical protein
MPSDRPVEDTIAQMTAASIENCDLDPREFMLVRIGALEAVGAHPVSYLANAGTAVDMGITLEDVQNILVTVAPIVGAPRTVEAAANIARALGFAVAVAEAELDEE